MDRKRPTKAVIAAAGFGTRFLPQTKSTPKEMLPLIDKPIIQYVVEELVDAGIKDIIIVTGYNKRSIEDHFDFPNADLTATLEAGGKADSLERLRQISDLANFVYVRQKEPLGNAAPLIYAGHLVADEPFIYAFGDDFITATPSRFKQMIDMYMQTGGSIASCIKAQSDEDYERYGVVTGQQMPDNEAMLRMDDIVEKPGKANARSDWMSVSGFLFAPGIIPYVQKSFEAYDKSSGEELKVHEGMKMMINDGHDYFACLIKDSVYYDAGNKLEYLKTIVDFALKRDDLGTEFRAYLKSIL